MPARLGGVLFRRGRLARFGFAGGAFFAFRLLHREARFLRIIDGQIGVCLRLVGGAEQTPVLFIIPDQQTERQHDAGDRHDDRHDPGDLYAVPEDVLRGAQRLHDRTDDAVAEQVPGEREAARLFAELPQQRKQQRERDDVEHALVKEEGVVPAVRVLDVDGEREPLQRGVFDQPAVHFLVEEVAPAADALREDDARRDAVGDAQEVDLVDDAEQDDAQNAAHDAANDGQAARADAVLLVQREPVREGNAARDAIEQAGADDADGQDAEQKVEHPFDGNVAPLEEQADHDRRQNDAADDHDRVIIDGESVADGDGKPARRDPIIGFVHDKDLPRPRRTGCADGLYGIIIPHPPQKLKGFYAKSRRTERARATVRRRQTRAAVRRRQTHAKAKETDVPLSLLLWWGW